MTSTISQLKSIINPVRRLYAADWEDIAAIITYLDKNEYPTDVKLSALYLLSRYESLTSQKLSKEMFVGKKNEFDQVAEHLIWFEGFKEVPAGEIKKFCHCKHECIDIYFGDKQKQIWFDTKQMTGNLTSETLTIHDLITEIERYNRTASKPISIKWTENFLNELVK